ncbi:DUF4149 domain-containing protein [Kingella kingae]|nr:DUF4149 domain-containing protein [Kingella kingae]MDK4555380.1 DUF4149 domain-containing protein [Kingella kingae]MDK4564115.1 DUF4149 domain-containing protein [Kingella kingae]MDK4576264.1 DUF4149 domain-containing protein [Kingella kingae]MDK4582291.1 DUF4149 domain-containing protein [Kingella kingae]MDK4584427.1 DUF4149 domain-containing protein [Kingella kingae]
MKKRIDMRRLTALLLGIWLGIHICGGYIATHLLFTRLAHLPDGRLLAAQIAGSLFHAINYMTLFVWVLVWIAVKQDARRYSHRKTRLPFWSACVLLFTGINEFLFSPVIRALRDGQTNWLHDLIGGRLGLWHGVSSLLYITISFIGLCVCIRLLRLDEPRY